MKLSNLFDTLPNLPIITGSFLLSLVLVFELLRPSLMHGRWHEASIPTGKVRLRPHYVRFLLWWGLTFKRCAVMDVVAYKPETSKHGKLFGLGTFNSKWHNAHGDSDRTIWIAAQSALHLRTYVYREGAGGVNPTGAKRQKNIRLASVDYSVPFRVYIEATNSGTHFYVMELYEDEEGNCSEKRMIGTAFHPREKSLTPLMVKHFAHDDNGPNANNDDEAMRFKFRIPTKSELSRKR